MGTWLSNFFYKSKGEGWPTILQLMEPMHTYKQVTAYLGCDAGVPNLTILFNVLILSIYSLIKINGFTGSR